MTQNVSKRIPTFVCF